MALKMSHSKILILDFGSQVTQLIARRVREAHVYCEIHPCDVSDDFVKNFGADGIILSGSHASVYETETDKAPQAVFELGVPVLGICYGMQTMAQQLGGKVEAGHKREFGYAQVRARGHSALFRDIQDATNDQGHGLIDVWMSHGDKVTELPAGFKVIASNDTTPIAAMADETRKFYAVQFHPEVTHTKQGQAMLERFVLEICQAKPDWVMKDHIAEAVEKIKAQVGDEEVILGLSGGVDSSVAAALIHKAIGDQLTCIFVDTGLLREGERAQVERTFRQLASDKHLDFNVEFESWPPPAEAMNWLASRFESVELIEPDDDFDGYVLVQVRARPSYDLIVQVQREVSQALSAHGGICDSWGILH